MITEKVTNNIRRLRFDNNEMTQKQLAEKVGVTRQTIVAIEKAKYSPSLKLAFQISRVFDKTLEEVFTFEKSMTHIEPSLNETVNRIN